MRSRFALLAVLFSLPLPVHAESVPAQFRGCDAAGWCRFSVDSPDAAQPLLRVRPDGIPRTSDEATAVAVRNRLNALMSDFIHQAKHIELHDLHKLDDGTYAASVTVTGIELSSDPVLAELGAKVPPSGR
ncbi:MAG TPA: hypothetical protein VHB46_17225 [Burkholderiales bacterium]|nr:hypothetical protein [Burkholderiales bacterium]